MHALLSARNSTFYISGSFSIIIIFQIIFKHEVAFDMTSESDFYLQYDDLYLVLI